MYDWGDIRIFLAVASEGSTIAAAKKLGMNQSTVSRRIRALEQSLGLKLFERDPAGYSLTSQGGSLVDAAGQMGAAADNLQLRVNRLMRDESGVIRVSAPAQLMNGWGFRLIADFQAANPSVEFDVDTSEAQVSLERGEADIALRTADNIVGDDLIAQKVGDVIWAVYASRSYLSENTVPKSPDDFSKHQFFHYAPEMSDRIDCISNFGTLIPEDRIIQRVNTVSGMVGSVQAGMGIGLVPCFAAEVIDDLVCCYTEPKLTHALWVVVSKDAHSRPLIRKFFRFAVDSLPKIQLNGLR